MRRAIMLLSIAVAVPAHADPIDFGAFFAGAESCRQSPEFAHFHEDLSKKYQGDNEAFGTGKELRIDRGRHVRIPSDIRDGIGRAVPINKGDYTQVIVPLHGTWRGLTLKEIAFSLGNSNGINSWEIRFDEPRRTVLQLFGKEVAAANRKMSRTDIFGSAKIPPLAKGEIVCDLST